MKKYSFLSTLLLLLFLVLISCKPEEKYFDKYIASNRGIFQCNINGELWDAVVSPDSIKVIIDYPGAPSPSPNVQITCPYAYFIEDGHKFYGKLEARRNKDCTKCKSQQFQISLISDSTGQIIMQIDNTYFKDTIALKDCVTYDLDTNSYYRMTILKNYKSIKKMEGTFEFTAINKCKDTLRITDGYFLCGYHDGCYY